MGQFFWTVPNAFAISAVFEYCAGPLLLHQPGWVSEAWQEYVDSPENIRVRDGKLLEPGEGEAVELDWAWEQTETEVIRTVSDSPAPSHLALRHPAGCHLGWGTDL